MRTAELRVRAAGASRARAAVAVDPDGARSRDQGTAAGQARWRRYARTGEVSGFRGLTERSWRSTRPSARPARRCRRRAGPPPAAGSKKGAPRRRSGRSSRPRWNGWPNRRLLAGGRRGAGGGGAGDPRRDDPVGGSLLEPAGRRPRLPRPADPLRGGHHAGFVSYRTRPLRPCSARSRCAAPGITAPRGAGLAPRDNELAWPGVDVAGAGKMTARAARPPRSPRPPACWRTWRGSGCPPSGWNGPPKPRAPPPRRVRPRPAIATGGCPPAARRRAGQALHRHRRHRRAHGARRDRRPGRQGHDGNARTREAKLACVFTQAKVNDDGRPVRDPGSSSYLATFAPAAEFATLMDAEARRRGADHVRQLIVLGDGALWIWNLATAIFPRSHPDRRPVPRPRTPARPRRSAHLHARRRAPGLACRTPASSTPVTSRRSSPRPPAPPR